MRAKIRPNKNDGICLTCKYYYRCGASDKARGMACGDYRRKEREDGSRRVQSGEMDSGRA